MKWRGLLIFLLVFLGWAGLYLLTVVSFPLDKYEDNTIASDSYYSGVYDSCIVIASKLSGGMYTRENAKWCAELTENARKANAFENRVPDPIGGGVDL